MISGWIAEENLRVFCTWCAEQVGSSFSDDEWRAIEQAVLHDHE